MKQGQSSPVIPICRVGPGERSIPVQVCTVEPEHLGIPIASQIPLHSQADGRLRRMLADSPFRDIRSKATPAVRELAVPSLPQLPSVTREAFRIDRVVLSVGTRIGNYS